MAFIRKKITFISLFILIFGASLWPLSAVFSQDSESYIGDSGKAYPRFGLPQDQAVLLQGKKVYQTYCVGCHGVQGDGKGPASAFLNPKPRNFQTAEFRFTSSPSGELPTDEDLYRTLTEGLKGSSMPSWKLVPEDERRAVIAYLKTFAPEKWKGGHGPVTTLAEDPFGSSNIEAGIKRGETAYHGMAQCYSCHAAYISPVKINEARAFYKMPPSKAFRKDLAVPKSMTTSDGSVIVPPDFTWDKVKRGTDLATLYHVIGNGITGTPMPTWKGILPEEDLWGIVYYVRSLAEKRKPLLTEDDVKAHHDWIQSTEQERVQFEAEMKKLAEEEAKAKALAAQNPPAVEKALAVKEPASV